MEISLAENRKGFTLLEIMIALAIIGSSLVMILHTVNRHIDASYENNVKTELYQYAKMILTEMTHAPGEAQGTDSDHGFAYSASAVQTEHPEILELTVHVDGHGNSVMIKEFVRLAPR